MCTVVFLNCVLGQGSKSKSFQNNFFLLSSVSTITCFCIKMEKKHTFFLRTLYPNHRLYIEDGQHNSNDIVLWTTGTNVLSLSYWHPQLNFFADINVQIYLGKRIEC